MNAKSVFEIYQELIIHEEGGLTGRGQVLLGASVLHHAI